MSACSGSASRAAVPGSCQSKPFASPSSVSLLAFLVERRGCFLVATASATSDEAVVVEASLAILEHYKLDELCPILHTQAAKSTSAEPL